MGSEATVTKMKRSGLKRAKVNETVFYALMVALPLAQFVIFYILVNANSVLLAFKDYERGSNVYTWAGFTNFQQIFKDIKYDGTILIAIKNSFIMYGFSLGIGVPLSLIFSYYFYKKMPASKLLQVIVFMPSIISAIVMSVAFTYFTDRAIPVLVKEWFEKDIQGLASGSNTRYAIIIFYNIWVGFGISVLLYSGQMSAIDESITEAAKIDGVSAFQEFWHISLPMCYPTLTTFIVVGVAGILTNQMNLMSLYGGGADSADSSVYTVGYYLFINIYDAQVNDYPYYSALGILLTLIAVPMTLLVKYVMEYFDPTSEMTVAERRAIKKRGARA